MNDTAQIISQILTPMSVVALAYFSYLSTRTAKTTNVIAHETLKAAVAIDAAVNGKSLGEPSISADVETIKKKQERDLPTARVDANGNGESVLPLLKQLIAKVDALDARVPKK